MNETSDKTWVRDIIAAFREYGGRAALADVYRTIANKRKGLPDHYKDVVRAVIYAHSHDVGKVNAGKPHVFSRVSRGLWALRFPDDEIQGFAEDDLRMFAVVSIPPADLQAMNGNREELESAIRRRYRDLQSKYMISLPQKHDE